MLCGATIYLVTQAAHVGVIFDSAPSLTLHFVCSLASCSITVYLENRHTSQPESRGLPSPSWSPSFYSAPTATSLSHNQAE